MLSKLIKKANSIQYKFLLCSTFLLFLFFSITIYFWYTSSTKNAEETASTYMGRLLDMSNKNLDVALKDINLIISTLSSTDVNNIAINNILEKTQYSSEQEQYIDNKNMQDYLMQLSSNKYYLNGLTVFNEYGLHYSTGITMPFDELTAQPWYQDILSSKGEKIFIPPHYYNSYYENSDNNNYKNMVFSYAKAIFVGKTVVGYIIADIRCDILTQIFNTPEFTDTGYIYVIDSQSNELIFDPLSMYNQKEIKNLNSIILESAKDKENTFHLTIDNKHYLAIPSKLDITGWTTLGIIPKERLLIDFYHTRKVLVGLTLLFGFLAVFFLFLSSSLLTKNITALTKAVSKIEKGNIDLDIEIKSKDEVGQLYCQIESMIIRIKNLITEIKKTEKEKVKTEIQFLQSQINPHFLYNTLNTIKFIAGFHGLKNIIEISESLSNLLHINMDGKIFIRIEDEAAYIKNYLNIQNYKYNNLVYNIVIEEGVESLMTLKLLLQPIVENALVHGLSSLNHTAILNIKIYKDKNKLKFQVKDNGIGLTDLKIEQILHHNVKSHNIGLENVISRIQLYFGSDYGLTINSQPEMFTIMELTVPIITANEVKKYDEDIISR